MIKNNFDNNMLLDKNVSFITLGCKVNSYESDAMEKKFITAGCNIVRIDQKSDIVVINTCTVTNMADKKSRQMINRVRKNNPEAVIVATGCYVQEAYDEILKSGVADIVIGNNKKKDVVEIVNKYFEDHSFNKAVIDINDKQCDYEEMSIDKNMENTRAYIKIQDGCNQFCSYCIIPYARGRIRSRLKEDILNEVKQLAANGYKEVVVTGIHVSSYGMDFENDDTFEARDYNPFKFKYLTDILDEIGKIEGIERIRLSSLEPRIITDEFLSILSENKKICPHFHLSLQSGCDATLKRMNRKYDTAVYMEGIERLRKYYDNPAITTDVIAGFVGETDEEFETTYSFVEKCRFSMVHVFKYSRRKGTVADRMSGHLAEIVKTKRSARLLELTQKMHIDYMRTFLGKTEKVLFEESMVVEDKTYFVGHNERYVKIAVAGTIDNEGDFVTDTGVKVKSNDILNVEIEDILTDDVVVGKIKS